MIILGCPALAGWSFYKNTLGLQPMGVRPPTKPLGSTEMTPAGPRRICNSISALTLPRLHTNTKLQAQFYKKIIFGQPIS